MVANPAVTQWVENLDNPQQRNEASSQIVNHYADDLLKLIRGRLASDLRQKVDEQDLAQDVLLELWRKRASIEIQSSLKS